MELLVALGAVVVGALVLFIVIGLLVGRSLPVKHVATRSASFAASPERIWEAINDPALMRSRGVGNVRFETIESLAPRRLVRRVVGESDFGGTWTCEIAPIGVAGSRLVITENGEVYNPFFRFVSRFIVGHHRTIDSFLRALRRHLGETTA